MRHTLTLQYHGREFQFEISHDGSLQGHVLLTREQQDVLRELVEAEPEDWHLDQNGERLPAEELFEKSPWSLVTSDGQLVKVLSRSLDVKTGEAMFSAPSTYGGEFHDWLRSEP